MAVAYVSHQISTWATGTSSVVTKPVSLAVGDLMIAQHAAQVGNGGSTPPTGFGALGEQLDGANNLQSYLYYKIADSSDVAASNFTFSTANSSQQIASITRITGHTSLVSTYIYGEGSTSNTATPSIAGASITPNGRGDSLFLQFWSSSSATSANSGYAIATSNPSWTEAFDVDDAGNLHVAMAYGSRPQTTATGAVSAAGGGGTTDWAVQIVSVAPPLEATLTETVTGSDSIAQMLASTYSETITGTDEATAGKAKVWNNQSKNSTAWANQDKS